MKTMSILGAAEFLHIGKTKLLLLLASGQIPAAKVGREWVITDENLETYLRSETAKQTAKRARLVEASDYPAPRARRSPAPPPSLAT